MITNIKILKSYCSEYTQIENYEEAIKSPLCYDLHHRREISEMQSRSELKFLHLYYNRPPEELIFLEHGEHIRLHKEGKHRPAFSTEWKQKMSDAKKGRKNYWFGKHKPTFSTETRQKMSKVRRGRHWHVENGKRIWTD